MSRATSATALAPASASAGLAHWAPAALVVALFHAVWEGHGVLDPAFRNPDVAGIAYNARLLSSGGLPYIDSAEYKPPGAFLLFAPLLDLGGMRAVWAAAVLWGVALSLAVGVLASVSWGRRAGPRAAILHAACAVLASEGDINYSFWMALPFTLSAACACSAVTQHRRDRRRPLWGAAGALALLAVSIKPSAWTLLIVFTALGVRELWADRIRSAAEATACGLLGAAATALVLALPYLLAGELEGLLAGMARVSLFGKEYVAVVRDAYGGRLTAVWAGLPCVVEQLPGPLALALAGCAGLFRRRRRRPLVLGAWSFAVAALLGVAYTLRFFSHDNAQLWPALAVLAVRPSGLVASLLDRLKPWPRLALVAPALLGVAAGWPDFRQRRDYMAFMGERDHMIAEICRKTASQLPPGQPVLGWGWHSWAVYEHCQRTAPGRVFKVLADVTSVNTNTCNNGFGPMRLRPGPEATQFLADFRRHPPSLFLWSNYFDEMGHDPLNDWPELREMLESQYAIVEVRGPFVAMLRSDLLAPDRVARAGR